MRKLKLLVLLVEHARSGTQDLKNLIQRRIKKLLDQRLILKNRFRDKKTLSREDQAIYFSHWAYCAVHIAVMVPELRTPHAIAKHLGLGLSRTIQIIEFLEATGMIRRQNGYFVAAETRIHLEIDSPMISKHHINWRLQAMQSLDHETLNELHYSSVIGISREDLPKIREVLIKAIALVREIGKTSKDETIYCYTIDLFGLGISQ